MQGHPDGRVERGRATRDALIGAARPLFGALGYEGTSIEAILEAAGVARGALYHHFVTKAELFDAVLDRETAALATASARAARSSDDPLEGLRAGCQAFLEQALDPAVRRIALIDPPAVVGWVRWRELDEQHTLGGLRASIQRFADAGRLEPAQVDMLAHMVLAAVGEVAMYVAASEEPDAVMPAGQASIDTMLDRLFGGSDIWPRG